MTRTRVELWKCPGIKIPRLGDSRRSDEVRTIDISGFSPSLHGIGTMRFNRTAPVLLVGFGTLTGLIAVSGIGALRQARDTYRDVSALSDRYRQTDRVLTSMASGMYVVGILARDY